MQNIIFLYRNYIYFYQPQCRSAFMTEFRYLKIWDCSIWGNFKRVTTTNRVPKYHANVCLSCNYCIWIILVGTIHMSAWKLHSTYNRPADIFVLLLRTVHCSNGSWSSRSFSHAGSRRKLNSWSILTLGWNFLCELSQEQRQQCQFKAFTQKKLVSNLVPNLRMREDCFGAAQQLLWLAFSSWQQRSW